MTDLTQAISAHGTIWSYQQTPGSVFTPVAQVGDIVPPEFMRKEFDSTVHGQNIDAYVLGVLRRGQMTVPLNWLPKDPTHDHLTGMYAQIINNTITGHQVSFPTTPVINWVMSGQVQSLKPKAPVDGKMELAVTLRFTGLMSIGGVIIGT